MLLRARRSALLIVDVQERLVPHVHEHARVVDHCRWLAGVAAACEVPVLVTEHYPSGLGHTVAEVRERVADGAVVAKDHFSSWAEPAARERIVGLGRKQVVVAGMEAHVCVLQTVLDLAESGYAVHVVGDAVSSRRPADAETALARMRAAGVIVVSPEMVLFEWAERGGTERFRALHRAFLK
ncbi:MAG: hydrolase [Ectothiorhodospiraceae bacterium]|nr:hydrolase [Ectothiorhodospiraceae bacterium]